MDYGRIVAQKLSNALFPDVEAKDSVPDVVSGELHRFRKAQGGLWVGGTATLTDTGFYLVANSLNEALHKGGTTFEIPLREISEVAVEFGWLTKIVALTTRGGERYRIRCFGAKDFAEKIRKQAGLG